MFEHSDGSAVGRIQYQYQYISIPWQFFPPIQAEVEQEIRCCFKIFPYNFLTIAAVL